MWVLHKIKTGGDGSSTRGTSGSIKNTLARIYDHQRNGEISRYSHNLSWILLRTLLYCHYCVFVLRKKFTNRHQTWSDAVVVVKLVDLLFHPFFSPSKHLGKEEGHASCSSRSTQNRTCVLWVCSLLYGILYCYLRWVMHTFW